VQNGPALLLAFVIGSVLVAFESPLAAQTPDGTRLVRSGLSVDYPPYEYLDEEGEPAGFGLDLLRAVADEMGFVLELHPALWAEQLAAFRAGDLDMLVSMLRSESRDEWVDFATPMLNVEYSIWVRKGTVGIASLEDLQGQGILVERGSLMHDFLIENDMADLAVPVSSEPEALRVLDQGQFIAALAPYRQGLTIAERFELSEIEPAGPPIHSTGLSFAVSEGDAELLALLNQGIARIRQSGRYQEIYNAHFGVVRRPQAQPGGPGMPWLALAGGLLIVLLAAGGLVFWRRRPHATPGGAVVLGSYELQEKLGSGGMGEVWRARHQSLSRAAAVKLIRVQALQGAAEDVEHVLLRFQREARATAALRSPNTVELYDYGQTPSGAVYYAMELLEGLDLQSLVDRFGPQPAGRTIHLLRQVCGSLEEAHRQGLLHRDIKPANIFACHLGTNFDVVKVLDFGLVKLRGSAGRAAVELTTADQVSGTPLCMAPEMVTGESEVDPRADLYAVGCVAYWLLAGTHVFDADNPVAMAVAHATETPTPPSERADAAVPADLEAVVMQLLAKDPKERPETAADLARALSACEAAGSWSADDAAEWWTSNMPDVVSSGTISVSSVLAETR
jgi:serine/threonine protein kinase/ABC-type amino acid transport substrate-binding protein